MTNWHIKLEDESTKGPYTESQIRFGFESGQINDAMQIRQNESGWKPASRVRMIFDELAKKGFYLKDASGRIVGPFTKQRVLGMAAAKKLPDVYWIRQGKQKDWTEIRMVSIADKAQRPNGPVAASKPAIPAAPVMKLRGNSLVDRIIGLSERVETALLGHPTASE